ncbi:MAG: 2Fe-2S iron-sulfur cluster binding domain-containing protein [Bacteroidetes bacterium]|nr:2Fe-2S iron-sulfur cluster binding domain-containing protein [Bacteroidota bacterium]
MKDTVTLYITDREGLEHTVEAPTDMNLNLMEICRMENLGVEGTCGGMALCASCQVYVESSHELPEQSDAELDMLDQAFHVQKNSRLGCQIKIHPEIDGLKVQIAPKTDV